MHKSLVLNRWVYGDPDLKKIVLTNQPPRRSRVNYSLLLPFIITQKLYFVNLFSQN